MREKRQFIPESIRGSATAEGLISTKTGDFSYTIRLSDCDRFGCLLEIFEIRPCNGARFAIEPSRLQRKVTYLEGGLVVAHELDGPDRRVVMRSAQARVVGTKIEFIEVVVDPAAGITIGKWLLDRVTGERRRGPVSMARDTLERLATDVTELL
jgi:hypothetical protein